MASLNGQKIKDSYEQVLHVDRDGGGNGATLVKVKDGDNGTTFALEISTAGVKSTGTLVVDGASTLTGNVTCAGTLGVTGVATFSSNIIIADGKYIGQTAGPQILFDDTNNFLEINGCQISIGGTGNAEVLLELIDSTLDTTVTRYGIKNTFVKTAGATDAADGLYGIYTKAEMDHTGSTMGSITGATAVATLTDGTIAGVVTAGYHYAYGTAGTISGSVIGLRTQVDLSAGMTSVGANVYGHYIDMDIDKDPVGSVYMLYLEEGTNIDYGIYQNGTAKNRLGGNLGIGKDPANPLDIDLTTEDLEIVDAGSVAASEQDWIEVEVGGVTGYIRVFAAK